MTDEKRTFWKRSIENATKWREPHRLLWDKLLKAYRLDYDIGRPDDETVKVSRFVTRVRKIIAAIAYNSPTVFVKVDDPPSDPNTGDVFENISEALQRGANDALEKMKAKIEVQQLIFDTLFKYRGFGKLVYNPEQEGSTLIPHIATDYFQKDFPVFLHVPSEFILVDPLTRRNSLPSSRFIIEEQFIPLEYAKKDDRFAYRSQMKAYNGPDKDRKLETMHSAGLDSSDLGLDEKERGIIAEAISLGEYIQVHEIHDRLNRRRIVFANDIEQPIEDIEHPFAFRVPEMAKNPITGLLQFTGETTGDVQGFLIDGGTQYFSMVIDPSDKFYGQPVMAYSNDLQNLIVESLSRRLETVDRGKTIIIVSEGEKQTNPDIQSNLKLADDQDVIFASDVNSVKEITLGTIPPEQHRLETDARQYEAELLEVGMVNTDSATEAAGFMSDAELNRKWMQTPVEECYSWIIENAFSIMADPRFTPENWLLNVSREGEPPISKALENWWMEGRHNVKIVTGSASILVEQLQRNDTLALAQWLRSDPQIDQRQLTEMVIDSFGVAAGHDLFRSDVNADAYKAIQLEHQLMLTGAPVQVLNGEDHEMHMQHHIEFAQQLPQLVPPAQYQQIAQGFQQHMQLHQAALEQSAQALGGGGQGQLGQAVQSTQEPQDIPTAVRSNAQRTANAVKLQTASSANGARR